LSASFDAVVVGAGILGASTAYHLRKAGASVLLIEQYAGAGRGPTGASAAIIRQHYSNRVLSELTGESIRILADLKQRRGNAQLLQQTGWFFLVPEHLLESARDNIRMQQQAGVVTSLIEISEAKARFRWLNPDGVAAVVFEPNSGYADPVDCTEAFVAEFEQLGGQVRFGTPCHELLHDGKTVQGVKTSAGVFKAGVTVNSCGPWSKKLAATAGIDIDLRVYREQETIWQCKHGQEMPPCSISDAVDAVYLRPMGQDRYTIGRGFPKEYTEADPDRYDKGADDDFINDVLHRIQMRFLPFANAKYLNGFASLYDVTPDWYPFVGPRTDVRGYADACGGSGHGFKLAPALGARLAAWLRGDSVSAEVRRLSHDRVPEQRLFVQKYGGNRG
jgi:glycine/D-amino acid oxidase-like deaminating enzyme